MKKSKSCVLRMLGGIARIEVKKTKPGWPPCAGFLHQPRRPAKK